MSGKKIPKNAANSVATQSDVVVRDTPHPGAMYMTVWVCVAIMVLGGAGLLFVLHDKQKANTIPSICSSALLLDASTQYRMSDDTELEQISNQIGQLPDYKQDPNCVYIVTEYQILSGSLSNAQKNLTYLKRTFGMHHVFSKDLNSGTASIAALQKQFNIMQNAQDNASGVISPSI